MNDERVELLLAIARRTLDIDTFEPTGELDTDLHEVNIEDVVQALEAAYDAGLLVGYRIGRSECMESS
ncbi:DUF6900 domain-containing protein [Paraburkholderia caballeronis]|uniref:DUF6900 domain-containing protein n=1 Tax=Paraburkholderia caballeronis TaxID=416943 RepID=UPI0010F21B03|nr:hypothetical protein [Paraburkholderia caballeronis]TDV11505.1 hypothetical protein C7408_112153 [Paraburkholderia caballeronis]TDV14695.1 hypothetical protein C7406_113153 [Paraburkholderia caballeronis]TDV23766.1 hypothetical protein C7404_112153 [Paraburkholderia caballeronis]TDV34164.1 hypothetical protein C7405_109181 [Paraburkholderia caballeronis]